MVEGQWRRNEWRKLALCKEPSIQLSRTIYDTSNYEVREPNVNERAREGITGTYQGRGGIESNLLQAIYYETMDLCI